MKNNSKGITLIALVITVIVLLILAGVTINLTLGENGIFRTAEQAARNYKDAEQQELGALDQFNSNLAEITDFDNLLQYVKEEGVNKPKLLDGMAPIKFTTNLVTETTSENDANWYSYTDKQWANAQTEDGSMWVWIPRFAYKIVNDGTNAPVDVVFLVGSTDNYYDTDGNLQTAKRAKSATEIVDTTTGYTVHPAFTNETSIQYANGGWDEELTGIWVAKFEAAYAEGDVTGGRNMAASRPSSVNYTQTQVYVPALEGGTAKWTTARNYKDGEYSVLNGTTYEWKNGVQTAIKYPTFQGSSYAMNYISISDAYNVSRVLTENKNETNKNIYGLNASNADSHLMKNSEWGAVAYLCKSKYGIGNNDIYVNSVSLENSTPSVYAVTGACEKNFEGGMVSTSIGDLLSGAADAYLWNQTEGQNASTTANIYGVYDMSGGTWERTAGYVANGHANLKTYGASVAYNGNALKTVSTKYTTVYLHDSSIDNSSATNIDTTSSANYSKNTKIYGDAVRETSTAGVGSTSWNTDYSSFWGLDNPFSERGGHCGDTSTAGVTAFTRPRGIPSCGNGFRTVLVAR